MGLTHIQRFLQGPLRSLQHLWVGHIHMGNGLHHKEHVSLVRSAIVDDAVEGLRPDIWGIDKHDKATI